MGKKRKRTPEEQKAKEEIRLKSAELLLKGEEEKGILLALAAVLLDRERLLSLAAEGPHWEELVFSLLAYPPREPLKGSWPGGGGWPFLDPLIRLASLEGNPVLLTKLSRIALGAPLFLAATVATAFSHWSDSQALEGLADKALKAAKTVSALRLERYLGPGPKTRPAPTKNLL